MISDCWYILVVSESATYQEFFKKQENTVGLRLDLAETLWKVFLEGKQYVKETKKGIKPLEFKAEGFHLLGEIGLLSLDY